jgi:hypothetical protein
MRNIVLASLLALSATAAAVGFSPSPQAAYRAVSQAKDPPVVCGFRNTSYTGLCEERTPYVQGRKLDALCKPILDCLNDTRCIKTYCGATTIRQGWVLESATREKK